MRTSVILNLKGGVAKTATAVNLAAILAKDYRQRVLLVDADSQCNATEFFGGDPTKGDLSDVLRHVGDGGPSRWPASRPATSPELTCCAAPRS